MGSSTGSLLLPLMDLGRWKRTFSGPKGLRSALNRSLDHFLFPESWTIRKAQAQRLCGRDAEDIEGWLLYNGDGQAGWRRFDNFQDFSWAVVISLVFF